MQVVKTSRHEAFKSKSPKPIQVELSETDIKFELRDENGKKTKTVHFKVVHNLAQVSGLDISVAVNLWAKQTQNFTAEDLCAYVMSEFKIKDLICWPEELYFKIMQQVKKEAE